MKYLFFTFIYFVAIFFPKDYIYGGALLEGTPPTQIGTPISPARDFAPSVPEGAPLSPIASASPLGSGDHFPTPTRTQATVTVGSTPPLNARAHLTTPKTPARPPRTLPTFSSPRAGSPLTSNIDVRPLRFLSPFSSSRVEPPLPDRFQAVTDVASAQATGANITIGHISPFGRTFPLFEHMGATSQIFSSSLFSSSAEAQSHLSGQASVTTEETDHVVGVPADAGSVLGVGSKRSRDEGGSNDGTESDAISCGIALPPPVKRERQESSNGTNDSRGFSALRSDSDAEDHDLPMSPAHGDGRNIYRPTARRSPSGGGATDSVMRAAALASQTSFGSSSLLSSPHSTNSSIVSAELDLPHGLVESVIKELGCTRSIAYAIAKKRYMNQRKEIDSTPSRGSASAAGGAGKPSPAASVADSLIDPIEDSEDDGAAAPFAPTPSSPIANRRYQPLSLVPSNGMTTSAPLAGHGIPSFAPVLRRAVAPTTPPHLRADPIEFTPDEFVPGSLPRVRRGVTHPLKLMPVTSGALAPAAAVTSATPYNPFLEHARRTATPVSTPSSQSSSTSGGSSDSFLSSASRDSIDSADSEEERRNILHELIAAAEAEGNLDVGSSREHQLAELHEEADDIFERDRAAKAERRASERSRARRLAEEESAMRDIERFLDAVSSDTRKKRDAALVAKRERENAAIYAIARAQADREIAIERAEGKIAACMEELSATTDIKKIPALVAQLKAQQTKLDQCRLEYQTYLSSLDEVSRIAKCKMRLRAMADFEPEQYSALYNMMKGWISDSTTLEAMTQLEEEEALAAMDRARALAEAAEHKEAMEALAQHAALKSAGAKGKLG